MKIVVNRRYGGFGLSPEAIIRLIEQKSDLVRVWPADEYFQGSTRSDYEEIRLRDGYTTSSFVQTVLLKNNQIYTENSRDYSSRAHPDLIAVIEELGEKANGRFAELEIVEIPDGIDWDIDEYDGMETIHEVHRSW